MILGVVTAIDKACVSVRPSASVTVTEKFDVPEPVGVPEINPLEVIVKPAGNEPEVTAYVYGPVPPVDATVCEYDTPVVPPVRDVVVMSTGSATTMVNCFVDVSRFASVTFTVNVLEPGVVGVPVIAPEDDIDNPAGNEPESKENVNAPVPPVAATICEYTDPVVPAGNDDVVIVGPDGIVVVYVFVFWVPKESVRVTVYVYDPPAVGVPEIVPSGANVKPGGKEDPGASAHV